MRLIRSLRPLLSAAMPAALPALLVLLLVLVFGFVLSNFYQLDLSVSGYCTELVVGIAVGYWLYALLRPWWLYVLVQVCVTGMLYISNALKVQYFGAPVLPADFATIPVLLDQLSGWRYLLVLMPFVVLGLLFLAGLRWRWRTPLLLAAGIALVLGGVEMEPRAINNAIGKTYGRNEFQPLLNFKARGPYLYLFDEYAHDRAKAGDLPTQPEVQAALKDAGLKAPLPAPSLAAPRDIYVFMMETLWDPSLLKAAHYSRDPLAPAYRALWEQAGESKSMVPVFGSGTPNSEFEVLCGEPVYDNSIVFVTTLRRPMLCLPRFLARLGYHTYALTPDTYGLWNRGDALRFLGFQRFYDGNNLDLGDRNGAFLSDASLFDQVDLLLGKEALPGPRLTYISTDSGHYPFELDNPKRPPLITSTSSNPLVTGYANVVYYDTAELTVYIQRIRARDPDAIIVAFGDHLPVLGDGLAEYTRSGLMAPTEARLDPTMLETHQSTPLLVIDGRHGPLKLGHVSLFEIPRLLLSLLGVTQDNEFDLFAPPSGLHVRPHMGRLLVVPRQGEPQFCTRRSKSGDCPDVWRWYVDGQILEGDILAGSDYTAQALYGADTHALDMPPVQMDYLSQASASRPCDIQVLDWQPRSTVWGRRFNTSDDGGSVIRIEYRGEVEDVRVWFGFEEMAVLGNEGHLAAKLVGRLPLLLPGNHELTLSCNGDPTRIKLGEFHVGL